MGTPAAACSSRPPAGASVTSPRSTRVGEARYASMAASNLERRSLSPAQMQARVVVDAGVERVGIDADPLGEVRRARGEQRLA